jgi:hypothetical protein
MSVIARVYFPKWSSSRLHDDRWVESEAFYQGAHRGVLDHGLAELQAGFEKQKSDLKAQSSAKQKRLEAELEHIEKMGPPITRLWAAVQERVGNSVPALIAPILVALIGAGALFCEALLLAPAMDVLSVTDPIWQRAFAFGISAIAALAFHFAWQSFTSSTFSLIRKIILRTIAGIFAVGLVFWGLFRGLQVGFAATLDQNPLGGFLAGHPILAGCFYVLVTLGIPVMAASASHFSMDQLHTWWEWKTAKRAANSLSLRTAQVRKNLEAEHETLAQSLKKTDEECKRHCAIYRQHHALGGKRGARQDPYWTVKLKATLVALLSCLVLFDAVIYPELLIVPVVIWLAAFWHFRKKWQSPGHADFYEMEIVQFAEPASDIEDAKQPPFLGGGSNKGLRP